MGFPPSLTVINIFFAPLLVCSIPADKASMKKLKMSGYNFMKRIQIAYEKIFGEALFEQNGFVSVWSLLTALGTLHLGSNSNTRSEIQELAFSAFDSSELKAPHRSLLNLTKEIAADTYEDTIKVSNRLYLQNDYGVLQSFQDDMEKCHLSDALEFDFGKSEEARNSINKWVEEQTMNRIDNLIPDGKITSATKLVYSVHFYGTWKHEFDPSLTSKQDFFIVKNGVVTTTKKVDMMSRTVDFTFCRFDGLEAEILKLDYAEGPLSMLIILPDKVTGQPDVIRHQEEFDYASCANKNSAETAEIFVPKMEIKASYPTKNIFRMAGMRNVFDPNKADLSGITKDDQLFVDEIYHQAFLSINEEGTEASVNRHAALGFGQKVFKVDHPFSIKIVEKKFENVLFEGAIADPSV